MPNAKANAYVNVPVDVGEDARGYTTQYIEAGKPIPDDVLPHVGKHLVEDEAADFSGLDREGLQAEARRRGYEPTHEASEQDIRQLLEEDTKLRSEGMPAGSAGSQPVDEESEREVENAAGRAPRGQGKATQTRGGQPQPDAEGRAVPSAEE